MIDVIDDGHGAAGLRVLATAAQVEQVLDHAEEVLAADEHEILGAVEVELAVDPEATHAPKAVAVVVKELLEEERAGLLDLRRVAGPQLRVDAEQRTLVVVRVGEGVAVAVLGVALLLFNGDGVEDEDVAGILDDLQLAERAVLDRLGVLADLAADGHEDLARLRVDDVRRGPVLGLDVLGLDVADLVEDRDELVGAGGSTRECADLLQGLLGRLAVVTLLDLAHRLGRGVGAQEAAQERRSGELGRLVDSHRQDVLLRDLKLDPAAALWDHAGGVERTITLAREDREVNAGGAVQLADDDALGAVHDELAATHHDGELTEVDLLLGHVRAAFALQAHAHAEGAAVREAQLAALVGGIPGLLERVVHVLELHRPVVALDREDLKQQRLKAQGLQAIVGVRAELQEALVRVGLDLREVRNRSPVAPLGEVANGAGGRTRTGRRRHCCHRVPLDAEKNRSPPNHAFT